MITVPLYSLSYHAVVTDENGSLSIDVINVSISSFTNPVYLRLAFSPNGDGINDYFFVQSHISVAQVISFQIFDRWGTLLFSEANFSPNDASYDWNGIYNGVARNPDGYVFQVEYELLDGVREKIEGDFVLMR